MPQLVKKYLRDVLTFRPVFTGHLECRQDALLDVERLRRLLLRRANVGDAAVDEWKVKLVTLEVVDDGVGDAVAERHVAHLFKGQDCTGLADTMN